MKIKSPPTNKKTSENQHQGSQQRIRNLLRIKKRELIQRARNGMENTFQKFKELTVIAAANPENYLALLTKNALEKVVKKDSKETFVDEDNCKHEFKEDGIATAKEDVQDIPEPREETAAIPQHDVEGAEVNGEEKALNLWRKVRKKNAGLLPEAGGISVSGKNGKTPAVHPVAKELRKIFRAAEAKPESDVIPETASIERESWISNDKTAAISDAAGGKPRSFKSELCVQLKEDGTAELVNGKLKPDACLGNTHAARVAASTKQAGRSPWSTRGHPCMLHHAALQMLRHGGRLTKKIYNMCVFTELHCLKRITARCLLQKMA